MHRTVQRLLTGIILCGLTVFGFAAETVVGSTRITTAEPYNENYGHPPPPTTPGYSSYPRSNPRDFVPYNDRARTKPYRNVYRSNQFLPYAHAREQQERYKNNVPAPTGASVYRRYGHEQPRVRTQIPRQSERVTSGITSGYQPIPPERPDSVYIYPDPNYPPPQE